MTQINPYLVLGVPRTATRAEIGRAYRALARKHHPDVGAAPSPTMARINEAWHILSDPTRRARWDRQHTVVEPPHWAPAPARPAHQRPMRRAAPEAAAPPSAFDSGWVAAAVLALVAVLVGAVMLGVSAASQPPDTRVRFESDELSFLHPDDWTVAEGAEGQDVAHRIVAHLVSFPVGDDELCRRFDEECTFDGGGVPAGEASILITSWRSGEPQVPDPARAGGDAIIGGRPAALEISRTESGVMTAWWQLSPPGFPFRWIEIRADIAGQRREAEAVVTEIQAMLETVEFGQ